MSVWKRVALVLGWVTVMVKTWCLTKFYVSKTFSRVSTWMGDRQNILPPVRLELTAFRLWDWRAAYCATEASGWTKHFNQVGGKQFVRSGIVENSFVRSGIWTHALMRGPEFSIALPIKRARLCLESGALDHSAILTLMRVLGNNNIPSGDQTQDLCANGTTLSRMKKYWFVRSGIRTHAHIRGPERSGSSWTRRTSLESGALDHSAMLTADPCDLAYRLLDKHQPFQGHFSPLKNLFLLCSREHSFLFRIHGYPL